MYRTAVGRLFVDAVDIVDPARISARDVRRGRLRRRARKRQPSCAAPRICPRIASASTRCTRRIRGQRWPHPDVLGDDEVHDLDERLARLDRASSHGPWTLAVLDAIAARPAVRAADLAQSLGRETQPFKLDVRKLKNLGLTISLEVGYRLSPRGEAYLRHRRGPGRRPRPDSAAR